MSPRRRLGNVLVLRTNHRPYLTPALSLPLRGLERESNRRTRTIVSVRRREPRSGEVRAGLATVPHQLPALAGASWRAISTSRKRSDETASH